MNIREAENKTGLSRANIRFYEKEGLLSPVRRENSYRDYSDGDVDTLMRIKLLRRLGVGLDDIRALERGEASLHEILSLRLEGIQEEADALKATETVVGVILGDRSVNYFELDAARYLSLLDSQNSSAPETDSDPGEVRPFSRLFARSLDSLIYTFIFNIVWFIVLRGYPQDGDGFTFARFLAVLGMSLLFEPLMLSRFGTTPGKLLFGIRVVSDSGERLTYSQALERLFNVLWYGEGFAIPIFSLVRICKSFNICINGRELPWEKDNMQIYIPKKRGPVALKFIGLYALIIVLNVGMALYGEMPRNRGELTTAEFAENMNDYKEFAGTYPLYTMTNDLVWERKTSYSGTYTGSVVLEIGTSSDPPLYSYKTENGELTSVSFTFVSTENRSLTMPEPDIVISSVAFIGAQKGINPLTGGVMRILNKLKEQPAFTDYDFSLAGVDVSCRVEYIGYDKAGHYLHPFAAADDRMCTVTYTMTKQA